MKNLKILILSLILSCATVPQETFKIVLDLNLPNFKKHLEIKGNLVEISFVFIAKEGDLKTFSTKKKLSKEEVKFLKERLDNLPWDSIKDRYASKEAIMLHTPPILISISYKDKNKNIIILGDPPEELLFIFNTLEPYLQPSFGMLK